MTTKFLPDFDPLITKFGAAQPYEREYEGWILRGMEDYFRELGLQFDYMTVGGKIETAEGMDQFLQLGGKYFCLQFKRPYLHKGRSRKIARDCDHLSLYWDLGLPLSKTAKSSQFDLIKSSLCTYYVLPTFLNRDLRRVSLNHTLFYHPNILDGERLFLSDVNKHIYLPIKYETYYNLKNEQQVGAIETLSKEASKLNRQPNGFEVLHGVRWGRLAEGLLHCNIGQVWNASEAPENLKKQLNKAFTSKKNEANENPRNATICRLSSRST